MAGHTVIGVIETLDQTDRRLLNTLQAHFPLVPEPFEAIGAMVGLPGGTVEERVQRLKADGVIRQISAIFDSRRLGYQSTLVAMSVPPERVDEVASSLNRHPGITHNYLRTHPYNLWFTLTLGPGQNLEEESYRLTQQAGVEKLLFLPARRVFKVRVLFDMVGGDNVEDEGSYVAGVSNGVPSEDDKEIVRQLQKDMAIITHPFKPLSVSLGLSEEELLEKARQLLKDGIMRRYGAVLRHRKAGFTANAMTVWVVPEDRVEETGKAMAAFPAVTHCYQRPTYPDWPYSLFAMIHGAKPEECQRVAQGISQETGVDDYALLYSTKEYKKTRVIYFEK